MIGSASRGGLGASAHALRLELLLGDGFPAGVAYPIVVSAPVGRLQRLLLLFFRHQPQVASPVVEHIMVLMVDEFSPFGVHDEPMQVYPLILELARDVVMPLDVQDVPFILIHPPVVPIIDQRHTTG